VAGDGFAANIDLGTRPRIFQCIGDQIPPDRSEPGRPPPSLRQGCLPDLRLPAPNLIIQVLQDLLGQMVHRHPRAFRLFFTALGQHQELIYEDLHVLYLTL